MRDTKEMILLLTACINPKGMAFTKLQDSRERLRQYRVSLDWYLQHVTNRIVFVENTGYDISSMYDAFIRDGRLEVLVFQGNDFDKSKGKGYGESIIIEYALKNSVFLKDGANVIKITGRLICKNVGKIVRRYTDADTVYALMGEDDNNSFELNSQVIVAPVVFWKNYFTPEKEKIDDGKHYWFEHLLYDTKNRWVGDGHHFKEMWVPLNLQGLSGSTGATVAAPAFYNLFSFYLHYILHRFGYYGPISFWNRCKQS